MNKKTDLRVIKSKTAIKKAFLELIREKGYANITITDIAKRAMINRKTFYMHYESTEELYNTVINELFDVLSPALDNIPYLQRKAQRKYIIELLMLFKKHKDIFNTLVNDTTSTAFINKMKQKMNNDLISKAHIDKKVSDTTFSIELLSDAYFSLFFVFSKWWMNTTDVSANDVVDRMISFFSQQTLEILGINFDGYNNEKLPD